MKHLAIVPARSGSKGFPHKNIHPLCGKPLLAYSVEAALASRKFDTVHVSTDSEEYAAIARKYGADIPFLRSRDSATDTASSWSVVLEVLEKYEAMGKNFDTVTLLQPTSPLRTEDDIVSAFTLFQEKRAVSVVSVCEMEHSPLWCNTLPETLCMDQFISSFADKPRQSLQTYYRINGAIYLTTVNDLKVKGSLAYDRHCFAYIMPRERSIDIDEALDLTVAEAILNQHSRSLRT